MNKTILTTNILSFLLLNIYNILYYIIILYTYQNCLIEKNYVFLDLL